MWLLTPFHINCWIYTTIGFRKLSASTGNSSFNKLANFKQSSTHFIHTHIFEMHKFDSNRDENHLTFAVPFFPTIVFSLEIKICRKANRTEIKIYIYVLTSNLRNLLAHSISLQLFVI